MSTFTVYIVVDKINNTAIYATLSMASANDIANKKTNYLVKQYLIHKKPKKAMKNKGFLLESSKLILS